MKVKKCYKKLKNALMKVIMKKKLKNTDRQNKWVREGSQVVAIAGNEKGRTGTVLSRTLDRAVVQGLNVRKKHQKGSGDQPGGIIELEMPLQISNLMLCNEQGRPVKLKVRFNENKEKELYYLEEGKEILYRKAKEAK